MELKIAAATASCIQLFSPSTSHYSSSSQPLVSAILSHMKKPSADALVLCNVNRSDCFGSKLSKLYRTRSCEIRKSVVRRSCSASLDDFSNQSANIEDLTIKLKIPDDEADNSDDDRRVEGFRYGMDTPEWFEEEIMIPESIKRKASRFDLPLSLRMIKKKRRWHSGLIEAGESAYCSVRKAFSSMVFIIRELHSYTLRMRDILPYEDLQSVIERVQKEIQASFVWLFRQVFSPTPSLMLYVMILLANFTVYSMASNVSLSKGITETVCSVGSGKTCAASSIGKAASVGGSNGGGGKVTSVGSGMGDEDRFDGEERQAILPGCSKSPITGETLNQETIDAFISSDSEDYLRTELSYQMGVSQDPNNPLLLANYAQFLYVVARDYNRAEEYFKKAVAVRPVDAEAYSKYAEFLWIVKDDLWAAEEAYLEAIAADPSNSYYAGNYAHFLWNTGGEDTCYPLSAPDDASS